MKKLKELYQQSLQELCHTKTVVLCGLLAALAIVLSMVASIQLGPYIKIGFSGLPNRIVEFLFGPAVGCLFGGALDLLKYVLKPDGPFFFGFTLAASMGINLVAATVIAGMFALINYKLKMLQNQRVAAPAGDFDDEDEEDI